LSTPFSPRHSGPQQTEPSGAARPAATIDAMPDPWGVRRAENLLTSLEGIISARVVTTPLGEVSEIHVLAQAGLTPKQIVRNVESALLAQLGLKVDHRKISIAQTADVRPLEAGAAQQQPVAMHPAAAPPPAQQPQYTGHPGSGAHAAVGVPPRAVLFEGMTVAPARRPHRVGMVVTLSFGGQTESAEEESADTPRARVEAAARAAVQVLDRLLPEHSVALEGARIVDAFERQWVFAGVQGLGGREPLLLAGTGEIKESAERAAVFAVLDATNRWVEARR
jgi:hypothetical protein